MALGIAADGIYSGGKPAKPGYDLPEAKAEAVAEKPVAAVPLPVLLAKADVTKGQADTKVCQACHTFEKGAGVKVGPPLYGVVDRPKGSVAGFDYSAGLKGKGGNWTFADLDQFITNPKGYVSGTKMGYGGEPEPGKRADIIAYLRTLSDSPAPLPAVAEPAAPAAAAKPAEEGKTSADAAKPGDSPKAVPAKADPAKADPAAKPETKSKPQGMLPPVGGPKAAEAVPAARASLALASAAAIPGPYHGADPYYPPSEATEGAAASSVAVAVEGPPYPYHGADPVYPGAAPVRSAEAAWPSPDQVAMSSPPMPYHGVDPVYPGSVTAAAADAPSSAVAMSSPPMPYHGVDPVYPGSVTAAAADAPASSVAMSSPPMPYHGVDPVYPGSVTAAAADAPSSAVAMSSPPMPYHGVDPVYPTTETAAAGKPAPPLLRIIAP